MRRFDLNAMNRLELLLEMTLRASFLNWEVRRSFPARDPPAARWDRQPYRPRTPCGRSKPSLAICLALCTSPALLAHALTVRP